MSRDRFTSLRPDSDAAPAVHRAWRQLLLGGAALPPAVLVVALIGAWPVRLAVCLGVVAVLYRVPDRVQVLREAREARWRGPRRS